MFRALFYLGMVEVVDDHGFALSFAEKGFLIRDIPRSRPLGVLRRFRVQHMPIRPVPAVIDVAVKGEQVGMFFRDIAHDVRLKIAAQVEVFQPDIVTASAHPVHNGENIRDAGEYGRDKTSGPYPRLMALAQRVDTPLYAHRPVHIRPERLVQRVDGETHHGRVVLADHIEIAQHEVGFGGDDELYPTALHLFEKGARAAELLLLGVVRIGHRAYYDGLAAVLFGVRDGLPELDVDKFAPRFRVSRKPLHETGATIPARVRATDIRVDGIARYGQIGFGEYAADFGDPDLHIKYAR